MKDEKEKTPDPPEELRRDVRKPAPIRPWDIGKENTSKVLSQEEWMEKKRLERNEEFAPPNLYSSQKSRRKRQPEQVREERQVFNMEPVPIEDELEEEKVENTRGRGAEIPPPPTFEMYGPTSKPYQTTRPKLNPTEINKSIEEGLNFIRKQVEEKQAKRRRKDEIEEIMG